MISIDQFRKLLDTMNIDEKSKENLLTLVFPCFDFRDFLKKKHGIDDQSIENMIQLKIAINYEKIYKGLEVLSIDDFKHALISRMSRTIYEFAQEENYQNAEGLEIALKKLMALGLHNSGQLDITSI